jgi:hypothetical protein
LCQPRVIVKMIVEKQMGNVDWQGKPKFSEKTCPSATFVHDKIPHDQTRVWTRAAAMGSRRLTAWAMARAKVSVSFTTLTREFKGIKISENHLLLYSRRIQCDVSLWKSTSRRSMPGISIDMDIPHCPWKPPAKWGYTWDNNTHANLWDIRQFGSSLQSCLHCTD